MTGKKFFQPPAHISRCVPLVATIIQTRTNCWVGNNRMADEHTPTGQYEECYFADTQRYRCSVIVPFSHLAWACQARMPTGRL